VANLSASEREVRKANRELTHLLNGIETPMSRLEAVQKRYTELLQDMKRTERDHIKAKKRGDQLQKEKDAQKTEMNKVMALRDKLEKLSRDLTKDNKKLKVSSHLRMERSTTNICHRKKISALA
jgi:DNA repair ATPase RecN